LADLDRMLPLCDASKPSVISRATTRSHCLQAIWRPSHGSGRVTRRLRW